MKFLHLLFLLLLLPPLTGKTQTVNSPYSNNGIGEVIYPGLAHNLGMGETGVAMPTLWHINLQNPALLTYNSFSSFQVALNGDIRNYESATDAATGVSTGIRFMAFSFPVVRDRWTSAVALLPYSTVNYNTFSLDSIEGLRRLTRFQGSGGLSKLNWSNGVRVFKTLTLGVEVAHLFGSTERASHVQLAGDTFAANYTTSYQEKSYFRDFQFLVGASYRQKLKAGNFLNIGATHELSGSLDGTRDRVFERLTLSGVSIEELVLAEGEEVSWTLPRTYTLGFSYEKLNKVKTGLDVEWKDYAGVRNDFFDLTVRNTINVAAGLEWMPDVTSVTSYWKRASYRLGINRRELPYEINNTPINDFGINFGASFPVSGYSSLDAAFKVGSRGTTDNNLIREQYFQIVIGATINDRWFIKRRFD